MFNIFRRDKSKVISPEKYDEIYKLLDKVSPVDFDCGKLCGAICCSCDSKPGKEDDDEFGSAAASDNEFDMGIYLMPGEGTYIKSKGGKDDFMWTKENPQDYDFPKSWKAPLTFIRCKTPPTCRRHLRPIQCRTFPLAPHIDENGDLRLICNAWELPYECPLISENMLLNGEFADAAYEAWKMLIEDPAILDFVIIDSNLREKNGIKFEYVI